MVGSAPILCQFRTLGVTFVTPAVPSTLLSGTLAPKNSSMAAQRLKSGERLQQKRTQVGMSLRDVHKASLQVAKEFRNRKFIVPASRLHSFETQNATPNVYRLYTLTRVYGCSMKEMFSWYGIPWE
ncbi:MAG TPA: hypothetical protein VF447_13015 [Terriglobales bacterium]